MIKAVIRTIEIDTFTNAKIIMDLVKLLLLS